MFALDVTYVALFYSASIETFRSNFALFDPFPVEIRGGWAKFSVIIGAPGGCLDFQYTAPFRNQLNATRVEK